MSAERTIFNCRTNRQLVARARFGAGFFSRLIGMQFKRELTPAEGVLYSCPRPGRLSAAIHTMGMRFSIGVIWLDENLTVVDTKLAKPWKLAHVPRSRAMYYLEAHPSVLEHVRIGDSLQVVEAAT